jgi:hypothetical protein
MLSTEDAANATRACHRPAGSVSIYVVEFIFCQAECCENASTARESPSCVSSPNLLDEGAEMNKMTRPEILEAILPISGPQNSPVNCGEPDE